MSYLGQEKGILEIKYQNITQFVSGGCLRLGKMNDFIKQWRPLIFLTNGTTSQSVNIRVLRPSGSTLLANWGPQTLVGPFIPFWDRVFWGGFGFVCLFVLEESQVVPVSYVVVMCLCCHKDIRLLSHTPLTLILCYIKRKRGFFYFLRLDCFVHFVDELRLMFYDYFLSTRC